MATGRLVVIANTHIACAFNDPDIQAAQLAILCLAIQVRPESFVENHPHMREWLQRVERSQSYTETHVQTPYKHITAVSQ
jgi:hypothetical protein